MTGNGENIYAFAVDYEHDLLHVFDRENSTTSTTEHTRVYNAIMGDVIYAHNGKNITLIDPAPAVARHILDVMTEENTIKREGYSISLHASGDDSVLNEMVGRL